MKRSKLGRGRSLRVLLAIAAIFGVTVKAHAFNFELDCWAIADGVQCEPLEPWPNGTIRYYVNEDSFNTNLTGMTLTDAQARYWTRYTGELWRWRSGAKVNFTNQGDTNLGDKQSDCSAKSGNNFIAVRPGCIPDAAGNPDCNLLAVTTLVFDDGFSPTNSDMVRATMCIYGGATSWDIDLDSFNGASERDLATVMAHEWGHWLGLDHTANTLMKSTLAVDERPRFPTDDDIRGVRAHYGPAAYTRKARSLSGTSLGTPWNVDTTQWAQTSAEIGLDGGGWALRAQPSADGSAVEFWRAPTPISASSTWTGNSYNASGGSWVTPSIAAKPAVAGNDRIVAAWPNKTTWLNTCSGIHVLSTNNLFSNVTAVNLNGDCTMSSVGLTWDPASSKFIMAFLVHSVATGADSRVHRIRTRTSPDGVNWDTYSEQTFRSAQPPSIECRAGSCAIVYAHRGIDPYLYTRSLTVSGITATAGSNTTHFSNRQLLPPTLNARSGGYLIQWTSETLGGSSLEIDPTPPFAEWNNLLAVQPSVNVPAVAAGSDLTTSYLIWTE